MRWGPSIHYGRKIFWKTSISYPLTRARIRALGRFFMVEGWVKMSTTMLDRRRKILKFHWLKRSKTVPNKRNLDPKINDSKPRNWSLCFNFRFSSRKLHCIISRRPRTGFPKHLESKFLYILVNFRKKIFVPET